MFSAVIGGKSVFPNALGGEGLFPPGVKDDGVDQVDQGGRVYAIQYLVDQALGLLLDPVVDVRQGLAVEGRSVSGGTVVVGVYLEKIPFNLELFPEPDGISDGELGIFTPGQVLDKAVQVFIQPS